MVNQNERTCIMRTSVFLAASLAASLLSQSAPASQAVSKGADLSNGASQTAQMHWRCGRNNPAEFGTFGNGCLKQKRAAKKGSSNAAQGSMSS
jgi:hypothetical protein